ncbi:unnamed protein product [Oikopleura dioica]|uniref:Transporter n=1 Tax=Oikopleura dioica TaxID=34765 RepID=E4X7H6_OIKDI|nr:unnamed protein product [Oikopleura dioica]
MSLKRTFEQICDQTKLDEFKPQQNDIVLGGKSRKEWPNQFQFMCANIAFAVGLGNIWRFPYLAQTNGGGTFLIPYFISLFIIGFPILVLELSLGQRLRCGASGAYTKFHKGFLGVGLAMVAVSAFVALYYNVIVAWAFYYFLSSFQNPLPWKACTVVNTTTWSNIPWPVEECTLAGTQVFYWYRDTLNVTADYIPMEGLNSDMVLVLLLGWVIVFMISMNGAEAGGAFLYFIAITPYVVLLIFLGIGLSTDGGPEGIAELFQADWEAIKDARVWIDASSQIFFSLSVCFGGIVAFSSYNPVNQNLLRDATIVASVNSGTSLFASCVIFSLLGNRAWTAFETCKSTTVDNALNYFDYAEDHFGDKSYDDIYAEVEQEANNNNIDISDIFQRDAKCDFATEDTPSGTGLIFIAVAEAVVDLPGSFILSMIFFFMVILLGLGSMVGTFEGVITPLYDAMQESNKWRKIPKQALVCIMSCLAFAIGLIFATNAGNYWLDIFNDYSASINLLIIGILQFVVVAWIYGAEKWLSEIDWMIGDEEKSVVVKVCRLFLKACWTVLSPGLILFVLVFFMVDIISNPPTYKVWDKATGDWKWDELTQDYLKQEYSAAGSAVIAVLHVLCLIWIPIMLIKTLFKDGKFSFKNWKNDEAIIYRGEQGIINRIFRKA